MCSLLTGKSVLFLTEDTLPFVQYSQAVTTRAFVIDGATGVVIQQELAIDTSRLPYNVIAHVAGSEESAKVFVSTNPVLQSVPLFLTSILTN